MSEPRYLELPSFVRGYHAYMDIWVPMIGETLTLQREPNNRVDEAAVAVVRDGVVVGHVPTNLASIVFHFLSRDGNTAFAEIAGNKVNRGAGYGLEVPCVYKFYGIQRFIERLETLVADLRKKGLV